MSARRTIETRRLPFLVGVVALVVAGGLINASTKAHRAAVVTGALAGFSAIDEHSGATSSAWYCAGPLPLKARDKQSDIVLSNLANHRVRAELNVVNSAHVRHVQIIDVGARSHVVVSLGHSKVAGFAAANVLVDSAALGVQEVVRMQNGELAQPCSAKDTNNDFLAGGSTAPPNNVALSLFDPGATPAVANVSFYTPSGIVSPPAFQGIALEAGDFQVLNVGGYLPGVAVLAASVHSSGGRVVAGVLEENAIGKKIYPTLVSGIAGLSDSWYFSGAPSGPGVQQNFIVANPTEHILRVHIAMHGPTSTVSQSLTVLPESSAVAAPVADTSLSARWAELSASPNVGFFVGRQFVVASPTISPQGLAPANDVARTLAAATGVSAQALSTPVVAPATGWLVPPVEVPVAGIALVISNPSAKPTTVRFESLNGGKRKPSVRLGANTTIVIALANAATPNALHASVPIFVGPVLYARGSSGSVGLSAPAAIPLA
jgi:hypothetical protein